MGLKLEVILTLLTVAILSVALRVEIKNSKASKNIFTKELEFTHTTFTEVDTNKTLGVAYGTYGVRNAGVLTVDNLQYHTESIKDLRAKKGKYIGDKIYLDYNITVHQKEGSDYKAEHAIYDKKSEILNITSRFTAVINGNVMNGDSLRYDTRNREAFATNVNAVVYTKEK
jgi:hypothetical protein